MQAVASAGPVSIAYQVASDFHLYSHGVYDSYNATTKKPVCGSASSDVNHAVVVVGHGDTMEQPPTRSTSFATAGGTSGAWRVTSDDTWQEHVRHQRLRLVSLGMIFRCVFLQVVGL